MIGQLAVLILVLLVLVWVLYSTVIGNSLGGPYVGTPEKLAEKILAEARLKPGEEFWDLGAGDGRLVKMARKKYQVEGVGVEINPLLVIWGRLQGVKMIRKSFWEVPLFNADVVYLYLWPGVVEKIAEKLEKVGPGPRLVISRRFEIRNWRRKLVKTIPDGKYEVYFYKN